MRDRIHNITFGANDVRACQTAKALDLAIPDKLLATADEVIE